MAVVLIMTVLGDFWISASVPTCVSVAPGFVGKNIHRFSWLSNDHKTAKETDHVLVNRRWNVIMKCRVYRKPEFNSDHRPVIASICYLPRVKLKKQSFTSQPSLWFDVSEPRILEVEYQYQVAIQNRFTALANGTGEWDTFKDAHTEVAEEVLGFWRYVRHEWINTESCWKEAYSQAQPRHGSVQRFKSTVQEIGKTRQAELGRI